MCSQVQNPKTFNLLEIDKKKQQILPFEKLEPSDVLFFWLKQLIDSENSCQLVSVDGLIECEKHYSLTVPQVLLLWRDCLQQKCNSGCLHKHWNHRLYKRQSHCDVTLRSMDYGFKALSLVFWQSPFLFIWNQKWTYLDERVELARLVK